MQHSFKYIHIDFMKFSNKLSTSAFSPNSDLNLYSDMISYVLVMVSMPYVHSFNFISCSTEIFFFSFELISCKVSRGDVRG